MKKSTLRQNLALVSLQKSRTVYCFWTAISDSRRYIKSFEIPEKDGKRISGKVVLGKESASGVLRNTRIPTYIPECRNRGKEPSFAIGGEISTGF